MHCIDQELKVKLSTVTRNASFYANSIQFPAAQINSLTQTKIN